MYGRKPYPFKKTAGQRVLIASDDIIYMQRALSLACGGLGRVAPNPAVGCVIVSADGSEVVGEGRTADGGRPHAEVVALEAAGEAARGATVYVSLEPCAHHGETAPCAEALVRAGVARVVVACNDPDERVSGRGIDVLRDAGIEVVQDVCCEEAEGLNAGFFLRVTEARPWVTLKIAVSADGKIASAAGVRTQISREEGSAYMHQLRATHDAILVGMGTVLADDPLLSARGEGAEGHVMTRVVLGDVSKLPSDSKLLQTSFAHPLLILHNSNVGVGISGEGTTEGVAPELEGASEVEGASEGASISGATGVTFVEVDTRDIRAVLVELASRGITRLMVEGGAQVMESFLAAGYGDELHILRSPMKIGEQGLGVDLDLCGFTQVEKHSLGQDMLEIYARSE